MSNRGETVVLDLVGPASHRLVREPGVGSVSVGPRREGPGPDLVVAPDAVVRWESFDSLQTPAGAPWPRWVVYEGQDLSVFSWSEQRPIEGLDYLATADVAVDLDRAKIARLGVASQGHHVSVGLPSATNCHQVTLVGDPADFSLRVPVGGLVPALAFHLPQLRAAEGEPAPADGSRGARGLPPFPENAGVREVSVSSDPLDVPFDVSSLRQFPDLDNVELAGACAYLEALEELPLRRLALRYVPDLSGLPDLSCWPDLGTIIVWNCDAEASRRIRSQLKALAPSDHHRSVSKPRGRAWFLEEYGLPFAAWPAGSARKATAGFKAAAKTVKAATSAEAALTAVSAFTATANTLTGIETSEREDLGSAVVLLTKLSAVPVPVADALAVFDAERTF